MTLPDEIIENAKTLSINDFDDIGYAYCGYMANKENETETIYFLPINLKDREILTFDVPSGFCAKFNTQLKMGVKRSSPLILATTLNLEYIDKIPLQLFASSAFTKQCLTLMNNSMVTMNGSSIEISPFKSEIKRTSAWRNNLRIKLRNKMIEAKKEYLQK